MSQGIKSLLFTSYFPRSMKLEGGTALIDAVARGLADTGLEVTVHAPLEALPSLPYRVANYHEHGIISYPAYLKHLVAMSAEYDTLLSLDHSPATGLLSGRALRHHPRVVHYFVSPCQPIAEIFKPPYSIQYLKHWLGKNAILGRLSPPRHGTSIVATEYQRRQLCAMGVPAEKVAVIPYGITADRSRKVPQEEGRRRYGLPSGPLVGYLGHFSPIKGVPVLVEAFARLRESVPSCHLALAWSGKGAESAKVQRMIRQPHLRQAVSLLGVVDPGTFLSSLDVCVLPYVHTSTPHFPLVMLESLAVGTPVVSTLVGGLEECATGMDFPIFVPPNDPAALASVLHRLIDGAATGESSAAMASASLPERFRAEVAARSLREWLS